MEDLVLELIAEAIEVVLRKVIGFVLWIFGWERVA